MPHEIIILILYYKYNNNNYIQSFIIKGEYVELYQNDIIIISFFTYGLTN